jgi:hypothetical protein
MTPDYFASADTFPTYKAYALIPASKLMEQYQFQLQGKPNTNVGMNHPTRLFWVLFTRFDCFNIVTPFFKTFLSLSESV